MKEAVLGKRYELSLVIVDDKTSTDLNKKYRAKEYTPNVLSFGIDDMHGEIFLNMRQARREYKERGETLREFTALLVIHSLFHLKGFEHGSKMDKEVDRILKKFGFETA